MVLYSVRMYCHGNKIQYYMTFFTNWRMLFVNKLSTLHFQFSGDCLPLPYTALCWLICKNLVS